MISDEIMSRLGIDVENYNISLKTDAVRHILNKHSSSKEILKGQVPISEDDFKLIPQIISEYDNLKLSGTTNQNKPVITFRKKIGDTFYLVNYVSDKKHNLEIGDYV